MVNTEILEDMETSLNKSMLLLRSLHDTIVSSPAPMQEPEMYNCQLYCEMVTSELENLRNALAELEQ